MASLPGKSSKTLSLLFFSLSLSMSSSSSRMAALRALLGVRTCTLGEAAALYKLLPLVKTCLPVAAPLAPPALTRLCVLKTGLSSETKVGLWMGDERPDMALASAPATGFEKEGVGLTTKLSSQLLEVL